ncbi:MAG: aldo/keto reductase [Rhodobacteraceae bacterium]|nr:aldo/keto reductase [Paracoccaceae bacterium]
MLYNRLGRTDVRVSELCLGTMTFGTQTPLSDAHRQIDMSLDHGINILDTAEMYPVNPISKKTQGDSERIVGDWIAKSGRRKDIMVATKVSGSGQSIVRDGAPISGDTIRIAVSNSLRSLKTDYIDLYQLHWPNRGSYMFRQNWSYDPTFQSRSEMQAHVHDVLETMQALVDEGKVRHFGLSNESAWGTAQWLRVSEERSWPRVVAIQNEYSLLCRLYDTDLAELSHHEDVGLLAFSPLAAGLLTGKYQHGRTPPGSRMEHNPNLGGRVTSRVWKAVDAYQKVARSNGLDLTHMALAWCRTRPFIASAIFGATTSQQLEHLLRCVSTEIDEQCQKDIDAAHKEHPMPY